MKSIRGGRRASGAGGDGAAPPAPEPLSIRQLEIFVALLERGSFTAAAHHLGLSQSTVSGHVADLERRLGVRVVERGRGRLRATAAGEVLLPPARRALEAERAARAAVDELTGLLRGRLLIGASTIPAVYLLPARLAPFRVRHPQVALRLATGDSREVLGWVQAGDVELGFVGSRPSATAFRSEVVGEDTLQLVVEPRHPLARRSSVPVAEVLRQRLVLREEGSGTREATLRGLAAAAGRAEPPDLDVVCEVGSTEAVKAAVRAGLGIAFVSSLAVGEEVAAGRLRALAVEGFDVRRRFHVVWRKDAWLGPAAEAFLAALRQPGA